MKRVNSGAHACLMCNVCVSTLTCDDGCCLAPDLVFVYILAVVQFSFNQNPGAERQ